MYLVFCVVGLFEEDVLVMVDILEIYVGEIGGEWFGGGLGWIDVD